MPLYGMGGLLRSGKDTISDRLVEKHGYVKLGMSDPLHQAMMTLDPIVGKKVINLSDASMKKDLLEVVEEVSYVDATEELGYTKAKEIYPEYRRLLQAFGTDVMRNMFGENVWVDLAAQRIEELREEGKENIVITGIRYPNELRMLVNLGGQSIWVDRTSSVASTHSSETSVHPSQFDSVLDNTGTLEDLYKIVDTQLA